LPGRAPVAVNGAGCHVMIVVQAVGDFIHNGSKVGFGSPGSDDEIVRDGRKLSDVKDDRVFGLFIFGKIAAEERQFSGLHFNFLW
jgi:hypothetical protein